MAIATFLCASIFAIFGLNTSPSFATTELTSDAVLSAGQQKLDHSSYDDDKPTLHPLKTKVRVSSAYGNRMHPILKEHRFHHGIDFVVPAGTPVYASADGTITKVGEKTKHGKLIVITHADGYETLYGTLSKQIVEEGEVVKKGQKIAESGNTGLSTAPHLHYEIRLNGESVDPEAYLPKDLIGKSEKIDTPSDHPLGINKPLRSVSTFGLRYHPITEEEVFHKGMDFIAKEGTPVLATASGVVTSVSENNVEGKKITLTHEGGFNTVYANLAAQDVRKGERVTKGDQIGKAGNTGISQRPHLHYEVHYNGKPVDPADYLPN